jgi:hypothetical protein
MPIGNEQNDLHRRESDGDDTGHAVDSTALVQNLLQSNCPLIKTKI